MRLHETVVRMRELLLAHDAGPEITEWFAAVEADPAFQIPMRHRAQRFAFVIAAIS